MHTLPSATAEFAKLLTAAETQLPHFTDTATPFSGHWSRRQILGHLIDSAANNHQRFVRAQLQRDLSTPTYAQEEWVETERFNEREWSELVTFWLAYNRHVLHLMSHVPARHLDAVLRIGDHEPQSLEYVMIDYVRHLKHHLEQLGMKLALE